MFKKILVPLDGSDLAEQALNLAIKLARQVNGEVILLSVPSYSQPLIVDVDGYGSLLLDDFTLNDSREELTKYLESLEKRRSHPGLTLRTKVIDGDEAGVIVDTAVSENVDLIAMSTHGYSGFTHWMLGSITERVLHSAPCPVLIMRSYQAIKRLLLPLDGSKLAEHALEPAFEITKGLGCQPTLLTVTEQFDVNLADVARLQVMGEGLEDQVEASLFTKKKIYLDNIKHKYEQIINQEIHVAQAGGPVANRILEFAEAQHTDLIVMATHGHTGLRRWLYGSIAEKVLRAAHCHMLIVRPPDHKLK